MLASIAEKIGAKGMSIEDVTTELRMGKNGQREFVVKARVSSDNFDDKENMDAVIADLATLKEELEMSTFDIRVHAE
jgi:hypothetical protein